MPSEPQTVWMPGGVRVEIHLDARDTGGAFCLLIDESPEGWSLPPHRHDAAETIHVLAGDFEMAVAGVEHSIHIPRGELHSGGLRGPGPGRRVVLFSPAGMEEFFRELGVESADGEFEPAIALSTAIKHGWQFDASA
ncbi:MAG TPA: hypothetical protein VH025_07860 [Solirubrobacteraceae bacterium]|nr:hypothetical protein [Solirubrobacteraceae bacterium]